MRTRRSGGQSGFVRGERSQKGTGEHSEWGNRLIAGVPARIMRPRLLFISCLVALIAFGLLMVYSASSVEAQESMGDSSYFFIHQGIFFFIGFVLLLFVATRFLSWDFATGVFIRAYWGLIALFLVAILFVGSSSRGASRWIDLGFFSFQPSELIKPAIIVLSANLFERYFAFRSLDTQQVLLRLAVYVVIPCALIFIQPDLGTTLVICVTVFTMALLAGLPIKYAAGAVAALILFAVLMMVIAPYRLERYLVSLDPWADKYGSGFQATLAIMAFSSGGVFGRGIGNSTMKYSYLPEAHNDYILAIIGEEVGFVGTLLLFAVFATLIVSAFMIARNCPRFEGKLIAAGSATMLAVQFLINALGVLSVIPMSGKTMPFISYGGSSVLTCMLLAGLIIRVSVESNVGSVYRARRSSFSVMDEQDMVSDHLGRSTAGEVRVRRGDRAASAQTGGFSVMDGYDRDESSRRVHPPYGQASPRPHRRRDSSSASWDRVDLNSDPTGRLRRDPTARRHRSSRGDRYGR